MPGKASDSPVLQVVGLVAAGVALVGGTALGWGFGADDGPLSLVIGLACVTVAVLLWWRDR